MGDEVILQNLLNEYNQEVLFEALQKADVLDRFMDTNLFGMATVCGNGKFLTVNEALCKILEKSPGELIGTTFGDYTPKDILAVDMANVQLLLSGQRQEYILAKYYKLSSKQYVFTIIHVVATKNPDGTFDKFYVIILPVTQEDYEIAQESQMGRVMLPPGYTSITQKKHLWFLKNLWSKRKAETAGTAATIGFAIYLFLQEVASENKMTLGEYLQKLWP